MTFWVGLFGIKKGDVVKLEIKDPLGVSWAKKTINVTKNRARQFYYIGRRIEDRTLETGTYTGTLEIIRKNGQSTDLIINKATTIQTQ